MVQRTSVLALAGLLAACGAADEETLEPADGGTTAEADDDDGADDGDTGSAVPDPVPGGSTGAADTAAGPDDGTDDGDASTGAAVDDPGPGLGCEGRDDLLLCDDFEAGAIDEEVWSILEDNGATVVVDDAMAMHGTGALHVHLPPVDAARAGIRTDVPFPVARNHFFGRAMFWIGPAVPQTHASAMAARGTLDGTLAQYRLDANGGDFNSRYTHPATVEQHGGLRKFGYEVPAQQWLCIEWEYDGGTNSMRYWMDGVAIEEMTVTGDSEPQPWIAPIFDDFELGYRTFQAGDAPEGYDVVWDAFALATFRIGCGDGG